MRTELSALVGCTYIAHKSASNVLEATKEINMSKAVEFRGGEQEGNRGLSSKGSVDVRALALTPRWKLFEKFEQK